MNTITFQCPGCGRKHQANEQFSGAKARCLRCGTVMQVCSDGSAEATAPAKDRSAPARRPAPAAVGETDPGTGESLAEGLSNLLDQLAEPEGNAAEEEADEESPPARQGKGSGKTGAGRESGTREKKARGIQADAPGGPGRGKGRRDDGDDDGDDEGEESEDSSEGSRSRGLGRPGRRKRGKGDQEQAGGPKKSKTQDSSRKGMWVAVGAVAVLVVAGGVAALVLRRSPSTAGKPPVAAVNPKEQKNPDPVPPKTPPTSTPDKPPTPGGGDPVVRPAADKPIRLTAAMLAREVASVAAEKKYRERLLEVRGPFQKTLLRLPGSGNPVPPRPGSGPTRATPHAVLGEDENVVYCDRAGSPTPEDAWQKLKAGQSVVVRGVYRSFGELKNCELVATASAADEKYRGKEVELTALVGAVETDEKQSVPTLTLEPERTNGVVEVKFFFRPSDAKSLAALRPGDQATIRGLCRGRSQRVVEMHNARLVDTTAPEPGVSRLSADAFMRDYEDDLLDAEPAPAADLSPGPPLDAAALVGAYEADRTAAETRYSSRPVAVQGVVQSLLGNGKVVILENNTDQKLKVYCFFTPASWRDLGKPEAGQKLCVRGVCAGAADRKMIRLDNCEPADPANPSAKVDNRRLTADFAPFVPERILRYDVFRPTGRRPADPPAGGTPPTGTPTTTKKPSSPKVKPSANIVRRHVIHREGGLVDVFDVKAGIFSGTSLWQDPRPEIKWEAEGTVPVASLMYRVSANQVQVGPRQAPGTPAATAGAWQPILQLGIKAGAGWEWEEGMDVRHVFKLVKFADYEGRPAAYVQQRTMVKGREVPMEVEHVYVKGLGEVRRVTRDVATNNPLEEWRLVEDEASLKTPPAPPGKP